MKLSKLVAAVGTAVTLAAGSAHAVLVSNSSAIASPNVITFDDFDGLIGSGPTQVGAAIGQNVTFTASLPSTLGAFIADLGSNGLWGAGKVFAATGTPDDVAPGFGVLQYTFDGMVTRGAGAVLNAYNAGPVFLFALGADATVLEAHMVMVSTLDGFNDGAFYGITRSASDIRAIAFGGSGLVMDDLVFTTPVPEPGTYTLMLCGLGLVGWALRNRKRKQDATRLHFV